MRAPFVRSPYNYDLMAASDEAAIAPGGPSLTVQSMAADADINVIMDRFGITGKLPENPGRVPSYGDFTGITNFKDALDAVDSALQQFMLFPASIRAQFENSPQNFLDFAENPANIEQLKKWFPKESLNAVANSVPAGINEPARIPAGSSQGEAGTAGGTVGGGAAAAPSGSQPR